MTSTHPYPRHLLRGTAGLLGLFAVTVSSIGSELAAPVAMSRPAISQPFKALGRTLERTLERAELVRLLAAISDWLERCRRVWETRFARLDALLDELKTKEGTPVGQDQEERSAMKAAAKDTGVLQITTPTDREIAITRVFDAPRRLVFDAHTNPDHLPRWMHPDGWTMPVCEIDLRPGGAYRFVWRRPKGTEMEVRGVYKEIAPPERLVCTESWGGDWPETLNTLILSETAGKTTLTSTMLYPSKEARDAALATGMRDGASQSFERLDEYLRTMA